jgi:NagD protein
MDMDGVIVREDHLVPGADRFVARLRETGHPFLILTNNSMYTTRDLAARLTRMGLPVDADSIWTSALATAKFLADQRPGGSAFVIGEAGLTTALYQAGYTQARRAPHRPARCRPPGPSPRSSRPRPACSRISSASRTR